MSESHPGPAPWLGTQPALRNGLATGPGRRSLPQPDPSPNPGVAGYLLRARLCPGCSQLSSKRRGEVRCAGWLFYSWHQKHFLECHHKQGGAVTTPAQWVSRVPTPLHPDLQRPPQNSAPGVAPELPSQTSMLMPPHSKETQGTQILGAELSFT